MRCNNNHLIFLSHPFNEQTPAYAGRVENSFRRVQEKNTQVWTFSNHLGTHVDVPVHFIPEGKTLEQFIAHDWVASKISLQWLNLGPDLLIEEKHLSHIGADAFVEMLLLKTGHEQFRGTERYWKEGPGFSEMAAQRVAKDFPRLKFIGFDFISLNSFAHREEGRKAHKVLLGRKDPIRIIEDMHLVDLEQAPRWVLVSPLVVTGGDGSPVSVFAEIK